VGRLLSALLLVLAAGGQGQESPDLARLRARMAAKEPMTWLFTGDSITHGALHTKGWRGFPEIVAERIRFEARRPRDIIVNTGISGDTTAGLMPDLEWRVLRFKPDVVLVMFGMNDCVKGPDLAGYEANLRKIVAAVRAQGGIPVLMRVNPAIPGSPREKVVARLGAYMEAAARVAGDERLILVDHFGDWNREPGTIRAMMNDDIHPNALGHQEMAIRILRSLGLHDPKSFTGKLSAPAQGAR
jgi:acyl-CoA thioesterase I